MNKYFAFLITLFIAFTFVLPVFAEEFVLSNIGGLVTQGKKYNQWWYEPQTVVLKGMGSRGANIDVTIDGKFNVTKASATDGSWKYDMGTLAIADHTVIVASGDQSYSFILTIGTAQPPDTMNGVTKGGTLPETGALLPLIGLLSLAGVLIYFGLKKSQA